MSTPYPDVTTIRDPATRQTVRLLWERLNALTAAEANGANTVDLKGKPIVNVGLPTNDNQALTQAYGDTHYLGPDSSPSLLVELLDESIAAILPSLLNLLTGSSGSNSAQTLRFHRGTLDPDQKPTGLTTADTGVLFWSTDFDRLYVWLGSAWADAPGQPQRGQIMFWPISLATLTPPTGWAVAGGGVVTFSTATGGTASDATPDAVSVYLRSVTDGTGGIKQTGNLSATTGDSTLSATVNYVSGTHPLASFGAVMHHHPYNAVVEPPFVTLIPIVRL